MFLYITHDRVGALTGGGKVTDQEFLALRELGGEYGEGVAFVTSSDLQAYDPFEQDRIVLERVKKVVGLQSPDSVRCLAHCYSGCLTETVKFLKEKNFIVTYTVAAHDKEISREEHEKLGLSFPYTHLTVPVLWDKYRGGYSQADVIVTPSTVARSIVRCYPHLGRIEVIPHGVDVPEKDPAPLPSRFTVGYLGAAGPDKGLRYLLEAWRMLDYNDSLLMIGGKDSTSPFVRNMVATLGGGTVCLTGWFENTSDFYDNISLYVQPSATEGFGLEVLEAQAHGRCVLCSEGAGAVDTVPGRCRVVSRDATALGMAIVRVKWTDRELLVEAGLIQKTNAKNYTWDKIREKYKVLWRSLLK